MNFNFDLQLFGGIFGGDDEQTSTTTKNIPDQTANEKELENGLMGYNRSSLSGANSALGQYMSALNGAYTPNWSTLANNYNNTMSGVNSGYSTLASNVSSGNLPSTYADARQKALKDDLTSTVGNSISSLANRGILNSSVTNRAMDDISQNASDTLAKQYSSDLSNYANTYGSILGQQASSASNTLAGNTTAQASSYVPASTLLSYAQKLYSPSSDMYNTMYSGRMNSAGTTTTQSGGDSGKDGFWGGVGQIGSALIGKM